MAQLLVAMLRNAKLKVLMRQVKGRVRARLERKKAAAPSMQKVVRGHAVSD